jgi:uridylate kinase
MRQHHMEYGLMEVFPRYKHKDAKCYRFLTYEDASKIAGQVVQNIAINWASSQYLTFQVGKINSEKHTTIGALASQFHTEAYVNNQDYKEVA